jgi:hypothetical protein
MLLPTALASTGTASEKSGKQVKARSKSGLGGDDLDRIAGSATSSKERSRSATALRRIRYAWDVDDWYSQQGW